MLGDAYYVIIIDGESGGAGVACRVRIVRSLEHAQAAGVSEQKETALIDPSASIMSDDPMQAVGNLQGHAS